MKGRPGARQTAMSECLIELIEEFLEVFEFGDPDLCVGLEFGLELVLEFGLSGSEFTFSRVSVKSSCSSWRESGPFLQEESSRR